MHIYKVVSYQHLYSLTCSKTMQLGHHTIKPDERAFAGIIRYHRLHTIAKIDSRKEFKLLKRDINQRLNYLSEYN